MNEQKRVFHSGNELAALAAKQIRYHVMGYYPITPSTKIAEYLDELKAAGFSDVRMFQRTANTAPPESAMAPVRLAEGSSTPRAPMAYYMRWNSFPCSREPGFPW